MSATLRRKLDSKGQELADSRNLIESQSKQIGELRSEVARLQASMRNPNSLNEEREKFWTESGAYPVQTDPRENMIQSKMNAQMRCLEAEAEGLRRCLRARAEEAWNMSERISRLEDEVEDARSVRSEYLNKKDGLEKEKTSFASSVQNFCEALSAATELPRSPKRIA